MNANAGVVRLAKPLALVSLPLVAGLGIVAVIGGGAVLGALGATSTPSPPSPTATAAVPPGMLGLYQAAGSQICPQMPWQILAAVGTIESTNDTSVLPGVHSGANFAGAEGPMQFEPATFAAYDQPIPPGGASPANPYDPTDAVYAAARMLCANGAGQGDARGAIFAYNHSVAYVDQVWATAVSYGMAEDGSAGTVVPSSGPGVNPGPGATFPGDPARVVAYAETQLGVPYVWGGTTPGQGVDCSGLVYLSYRAAGITLPRTTYDQATYGVTVPNNQLASGDLLFFLGGEPITDFGHVAIYIGNGLMIQAPHTGAVVEITPVDPGSIELARRILVPTP